MITVTIPEGVTVEQVSALISPALTESINDMVNQNARDRRIRELLAQGVYDPDQLAAAFGPVAESDEPETADVFLQWKGADACFDLNCDCGTSSHVDGMFAYYVRCPGCRSIYEMPYSLTARKIDPATDPDYSGNFLQGVTE